MKKLIATLVMVTLILSLVGAAVAQARTRAQERAAVRSYINKLERKLRNAKKRERIRKIEKMIKAERRRLQRLEGGIGEGPGKPIKPVPGDRPVKPIKPIGKKPMPKKELARTELEGSVGLVGGMTGVLGGIRFHNPFDLISTSLRVAAIYAQGNDTDSTMRKHAIIAIDAMYRLNPPRTRGFRSYIGLGANYDVYTTGRVSGTLGGQAFYGIEGDAGGGVMYLELGYGLVRTGFSPNYSGINALIGYRVGL